LPIFSALGVQRRESDWAFLYRPLWMWEGTESMRGATRQRIVMAEEIRLFR